MATTATVRVIPHQNTNTIIADGNLQFQSKPHSKASKSNEIVDQGTTLESDSPERGRDATIQTSTNARTGSEGFPFNIPVLRKVEDEDHRRRALSAVHEQPEIGLTEPALPLPVHSSSSPPTPEKSPSTPHQQHGHTAISASPRRKSVQFTRHSPSIDPKSKATARSGTWETGNVEPALKDQWSNLFPFSRLRGFGSSQNPHHTRGPSVDTSETDQDGGASSRRLSPDARTHDQSSQDEHGTEIEDVDADGEATDGEGGSDRKERRRRNKRRKSRRLDDNGTQTAPTTPKTPFLRESRPHFLSTSTSFGGSLRPAFLARRATVADTALEARQGVSEDEGRERMAKQSRWRRGSAFAISGRTEGNIEGTPQNDTETAPRPTAFRRLTGFGGSSQNPDGSLASPWRLRTERASTSTRAAWQQLKDFKPAFRMRGKRARPDNTVDHAKSAELMAELTAGVPAALIIASMFQRDEHHKRRIPVLLEQVKLSITDNKQSGPKAADGRHQIFRIEMEYGNGLTRMKWVINRSLRDFVKLHTRYKANLAAKKYIQLKGSDARTKLPKFPRSAFPYARPLLRALESDSEDEVRANSEVAANTATNAGNARGPEETAVMAEPKETPTPVAKRRKSMGIIRRQSSANSNPASGGVVSAIAAAAGAVTGVSISANARKDAHDREQRRDLEAYLRDMIKYLIFRPESNRLCKFLELSALGIRLAAEGSYHGKEGPLHVQTGKTTDIARAWTPSKIQTRREYKWFLVRHSYVVCVDSPEEMNIFDVFLVDSQFEIKAKKRTVPLREQKAREIAKTAKESAKHPQHHRMKIVNSERKLRLIAKDERTLYQFEDSIRFMHENTPWSKSNRFDSFAPVRNGVFAQWLVDGRDYMWNVSRAISMAKDVIYIHDWWLSPELYMRRPAAISQKWRLDRLLQRKAQEGVKVFVIVYRNINSAIPIDSEYTKFSLLDLHPNVFVQRSPNQIRQGTFFWAHHEKICIVDHMVAFVGGIDLCFGRWDTPQHTVADDKLTGFEESRSDIPKDADHCQLWPGKDYSNPRVQDFFALDKPYEEMYDRSKVPRMPWHDISMQVVGQPARDLTRHFVQRWNYILRQRKPTRPTPFLLPPPDFVSADLEALGLDGTCEVQILRSCSMWSIGTPRLVEHSILNAYVKMIEQSDHFVYIENQFYISSCEIDGTKIENGIGDALVERAIRAFENGEAWKAIIIVPLMPGFQNTVASQDGSSVRLIMQCQYRSICRGDGSMFLRLRAHGIEPEDYISFYSLRSWGKIGPTKQLVTEQLYIHAKCMVVDDRIAIIGSANINERSMRGDRDSECAAVVRDTDMLWSTMAGERYRVGRFPFTLRKRLMREHLGIDVDEVMDHEQQELTDQVSQKWEEDMDRFHGEGLAHSPSPSNDGASNVRFDQANPKEALPRNESLYSFNHDVDWEQHDNPNILNTKHRTTDVRVSGNKEHEDDVEGHGADNMVGAEATGLSEGRDTAINSSSREVLLSPQATKGCRGGSLKADSSPHRSSSPTTEDMGNSTLPPPPAFPRMHSDLLGLPMVSTLPALPKLDDTDIGGPPIQRIFLQKALDYFGPSITEMRHPTVEADCMADPLNDSFMDTWHTVAENNTKLFRTVFRCMPDNEVKTWDEYSEYEKYAARFTDAQGGGKSKDRIQHEAPGSSGPPGLDGTTEKMRTLGPLGVLGGRRGGGKGAQESNIESITGNDNDRPMTMARVEDWAAEANRRQAERQSRDSTQNGPNNGLDEKSMLRASHDTETTANEKGPRGQAGEKGEIGNGTVGVQKRRRRTTTRGSKKEFRADDDMIDPKDADELLKGVQGHLVLWPYDW